MIHLLTPPYEHDWNRHWKVTESNDSASFGFSSIIIFPFFWGGGGVSNSLGSSNVCHIWEIVLINKLMIQSVQACYRLSSYCGHQIVTPKVSL